jgi:hypothetical protein
MFTIKAAGSQLLTYQWHKDGAAIAGATTAALLIDSADQSDEGTYQCDVGNDAEVAHSDQAVLTVTDPPVITTQPESQEAKRGDSVTFSVEATGTAPLSYQWRKNGMLISGATQSSYTIAAITRDDFGVYACEVENVAGTASSDLAELSPYMGCYAGTVSPDTPTFPYAAYHGDLFLLVLAAITLSVAGRRRSHP